MPISTSKMLRYRSRQYFHFTANIAAGSLGRISFAQTEGSKEQLLTKVNMFSDVYDKYVEFIDTAFVKIQHIVTALATHNRIVMPPQWNTPHVIMAMIQNVVENSMVRTTGVGRGILLNIKVCKRPQPFGFYSEFSVVFK